MHYIQVQYGDWKIVIVKKHSAKKSTTTPNKGITIMVIDTLGVIQGGIICISLCWVLWPLLGIDEPLPPIGHI